MKSTIITADDVRRAYDAMQTAEKACHRAIYGGSSERKVEYLKREIEYEYKSDAPDMEHISDLIADLAQAEADRNAEESYNPSHTETARLQKAQEIAEMRYDAYKKAYLTQCLVVIEAALKTEEKNWKGMHCHWKRTTEKMQDIIDRATADLDGITATYSGTRRDYSEPRYDATIAVMWGTHDYQHSAHMSLISYSKSDALEWPNDTPVCDRPAANFTAEQIDAEITAYYTAMKSIDAMRDRYIAECAALISQFGAISTRDLDRRAKVDDYDIRKVA
jgi:hypothetical protein